MPRLEGRRSNSCVYIVLMIVLLLATLLLVEFTGVINLIPNFGG